MSVAVGDTCVRDCPFKGKNITFESRVNTHPRAIYDLKIHATTAGVVQTHRLKDPR